MMNFSVCRLPEVPVEGSTETDYEEGAENIPDAPTLADALLEVGGEGDGFHLSLGRSRSEATDSHHEEDDEHEQRGKYQNAIRRYYFYINGVEFPRLKDYERLVA